MINESNKRKTQRQLQRTAVSVITHATYAIVLRKKTLTQRTQCTKFNARTQPHTTPATGTLARVRGDSDQYENQTKQTLQTNSAKKRKHTRRSL